MAFSTMNLVENSLKPHITSEARFLGMLTNGILHDEPRRERFKATYHLGSEVFRNAKPVASSTMNLVDRA